MTSILALDQGTTGSTALVVTRDGVIAGRGYREFPQYYPQPGWVEHDPEEIINATLGAAREAVEQAGHLPNAIGITNQRETVVVWERETGTPLHRGIVWQDRRTTNRCSELREQYGADYLRTRTGLVWDPYFSGSKIQWLLESIPGLRGRAEKGEVSFGTIDSWLIHRLTKGRAFVTDHTNASRTLLYNIESRGWDEDLFDLFGVPRQCLPEVRFSSEVVGQADSEFFGAEIPIAGIAGDQQAALFGHACWFPGLAKCTYGTGAFLLENIGSERSEASESGVLTTIACDSAGQPCYALEGAVFIAGAAVQWLRDELRIVEHASDTKVLAESVPDNGGVYLVPAFVGLGAPFWEPRARGTLVGLTRGTTRAHLARAALESMAYSTKDLVTAMQATSNVQLGELRVDGGAVANDWLMQYQADVLGVPVGRPEHLETTALGAAGLAGLAVGVWESPEEYAASREYRWFQPGEARDSEYVEWQKAVGTALYWADSDNS
jgi:glycerol kinase